MTSRSKRSIIYGAVGLSLIALILGATIRRREVDFRRLNAGDFAFKSGHYRDALNIFSPYAEKGNQGAQQTLGIMYAFGLGVSRDRKKAEKLLSEGFSGMTDDAGHPMASGMFFWIGQSYEKGEYVPVDRQEALVWYRTAAAAGSDQARERLQELKNGQH
jgi:uncharacterized protein